MVTSPTLKFPLVGDYFQSTDYEDFLSTSSSYPQLSIPGARVLIGRLSTILLPN